MHRRSFLQQLAAIAAAPMRWLTPPPAAAIAAPIVTPPPAAYPPVYCLCHLVDGQWRILEVLPDAPPPAPPPPAAASNAPEPPQTRAPYWARYYWAPPGCKPSALELLDRSGNLW